MSHPGMHLSDALNNRTGQKLLQMAHIIAGLLGLLLALLSLAGYGGGEVDRIDMVPGVRKEHIP